VDAHLVTIYSTYDPAEANVLRARLRGAGLSCWLKGSSGLYTSFVSGPFHVQVADSQEAEARRVLEEDVIDLREVYPDVSGRELAVAAPPEATPERETGRELALVGRECNSFPTEATSTGRELAASEAGKDVQYCPQCGYEYLPEIVECPDCQVALVEERRGGKRKEGEGKGEKRREEERLVPEETLEDLVWVTVYGTFDLGQALLIRSLLEGSDLPVFVKNEQVARTGFALTFGGFQVQVPSDCAEAARDLLQAALA
jgi:predicted RNA-binding Zn-ribbon protein involved in translation (DUF1610 family)